MSYRPDSEDRSHIRFSHSIQSWNHTIIILSALSCSTLYCKAFLAHRWWRIWTCNIYNLYIKVFENTPQHQWSARTDRHLKWAPHHWLPLSCCQHHVWLSHCRVWYHCEKECCEAFLAHWWWCEDATELPLQNMIAKKETKSDHTRAVLSREYWSWKFWSAGPIFSLENMVRLCKNWWLKDACFTSSF